MSDIFGLITADDINAEVRGSLDMGDEATVSWVINQVEKAQRRLLATCPTLESRLKTDGALRGIARDIIIEAVGRVALTQADEVGIKSESEDGYSYTVDPLARSSNIWFPDKDLKLLGCGPAETFVPRSARLTTSPAWHGYGRGFL